MAFNRSLSLSKVTVIVLNYQSYEDTIKYVDNLRSQKNIILTILIVDNCSPNGSFEILRSNFDLDDDVIVIQSERNGGYAYGNNYGINYLKNDQIDYIVISNNDILIADEYLLLKLIEEYNNLKNIAFIAPLALTGGRVTKAPAWRLPTITDDLAVSLRCLQYVFGNKNIYSIHGTPGSLKVDCLPGCFFMGRKNIFFDVGLLDENTFLYMEEAILAFKVRKSGLCNYLISSLNYEHATSKTISSCIDFTVMHEHLLNSRIYYHHHYMSAKPVSIFLLKLLFRIWKVENFFYLLVKRSWRCVEKIFK